MFQLLCYVVIHTNYKRPIYSLAPILVTWHAMLHRVCSQWPDLQWGVGETYLVVVTSTIPGICLLGCVVNARKVLLAQVTTLPGKSPLSRIRFPKINHTHTGSGNWPVDTPKARLSFLADNTAIPMKHLLCINHHVVKFSATQTLPRMRATVQTAERERERERFGNAFFTSTRGRLSGSSYRSYPNLQA